MARRKCSRAMNGGHGAQTATMRGTAYGIAAIKFLHNKVMRKSGNVGVDVAKAGVRGGGVCEGLFARAPSAEALCLSTFSGQ